MVRTQIFSRTLIYASFVTCILFVTGQHQAAGQATPASGPPLEERHPRYALQREDVVLLTFPLTPELNQTVTVQPDGYINLQGSASVYAQGLTAP